MKHLIVITLIFFLGLDLSSQVSVTTDLPSEVSKNKEISVNIKFNKGPIKNYSKYEMIVPEGITVKEVDCKYGTFSFEKNKVRIIWAITPAEPIYTIKVNFFTGTELGAKVIEQTYAYAEKGQKLELEMAKIHFTVLDSVNISSNEPSVNDSLVAKANSEETNKSIIDSKNQSKEAEAIGNAEKTNAELKIAEAKIAMQNADSIKDASEKKEALEAAALAKRKAEEDLAEADRILALSKSINESATQKEKLNQPIDSIVKVDNVQINNAVNESSVSASISHAPAVKIEKAKENAMNKGATEAQDLYKSIKPEEHHDDKEIELQVSQLRLDSKDALEVGTREKLKAEQSLHDAYEQLKKTKYIPDAEEKKLAVEKANADIEQAKSDLEIASKILSLSKSLEENAKEIERLHLNDETKAVAQENSTKTTTQVAPPTVNPVEVKQTEVRPEPIAEKTEVKTPEPTIAKVEEKMQEKPVEKQVEQPEVKEPAPTVEAKVEQIPVPKIEEKIEEKKEEIAKKSEVKAEEKKPEIVEAKVEKIAKKAAPTENKNISKNDNSDYLFTLQLGSFKNSPDLSVFKKLGKVDLRNDNGKFKVYYGKFASKQEASEMRQKTVSKGFDCFVVSLTKQ